MLKPDTAPASSAVAEVFLQEAVSPSATTTRYSATTQYLVYGLSRTGAAGVNVCGVVPLVMFPGLVKSATSAWVLTAP